MRNSCELSSIVSNRFSMDFNFENRKMLVVLGGQVVRVETLKKHNLHFCFGDESAVIRACCHGEQIMKSLSLYTFRSFSPDIFST